MKLSKAQAKAHQQAAAGIDQADLFGEVKL